MITKHYKSDMDVPVTLITSAAGVIYPFKLVFMTQGSTNTYTASYDGTSGVNLLAIPQEGDTQVYARLDKHGLRMGELMVEATFYIDADGWTNNTMLKSFYGTTGIMLVDKKIDDDGTVIIPPVEFDMNIIKGDTGETGIQGEKGEKGEQGIQGIQGIQGERGIQGIQGEDGDVSNLNHNSTINRGMADAHPISAITNLQTTLTYLSSGVDKNKEDITSLLNSPLSDYYWYGYEYDNTVSDKSVTRIGNLTLHKANSLPLQSKMKGCLLDGTIGTVNEYLPESDWTGSTLDGSAGQVMVETPKFYFRHELDGNIERFKFSELPLGGFIEIPKLYPSAYEASLNRTTNKLASVMNSSPEYRGGNNNAAWDGQFNSLLGRPATSISRTNFTTYARNRGTTTEWNQNLYLAHKVLYWMFILEYGTRDSQAPYTAELDSNGYKQGGLGVGVTTANSTIWNEKFSYNPFVPCGTSNSLGNGTGEIDYTTLDENGDELWTVKANRYRGVELPFGHIWKWAEGINVDVKTDADGGTSEVYVCDDPSKFSDISNVDYELRGLEARDGGYITQIIGGENGDIMPTEVGGGSTTFFCDYHYTSITSSSLRGVLFGGNANNSSNAGFTCSYSSTSPSYTNASFGSRLCFLPKNN